jgi:hypothetical protein
MARAIVITAFAAVILSSFLGTVAQEGTQEKIRPAGRIDRLCKELGGGC